MLLQTVINYSDNDIYNLIENDLKKAGIVIEFYSLINWCKVSIIKEEKIENYNNLLKNLDLYYKKYNIKLIDKIKNKKFLEDLYLEINKIKEKEEKVEFYIDEIPIFE